MHGFEAGPLTEDGFETGVWTENVFEAGTLTEGFFETGTLTEHGFEFGYVLVTLVREAEQAPMTVDDYEAECEMAQEAEFGSAVEPAWGKWV